MLNYLHAQDIHLSCPFPFAHQGESVRIQAHRVENGERTEVAEFYSRDVARDTGWNWFGPISIKIGDTTYVSDSIRIHVLDSLPPVAVGFWWRFEEVNGRRYLITEQRLDTNVRMWKNGRDGFASIKCALIEKRGLKISNNSSKWGEMPVNIGGKILSIPTKVSMYEIELTEDFKGTYELSIEDFWDWPEKIHFPKIIIQR